MVIDPPILGYWCSIHYHFGFRFLGLLQDYKSNHLQLLNKSNPLQVELKVGWLICIDSKVLSSTLAILMRMSVRCSIIRMNQLVNYVHHVLSKLKVGGATCGVNYDPKHAEHYVGVQTFHLRNLTTSQSLEKVGFLNQKSNYGSDTTCNVPKLGAFDRQPKLVVSHAHTSQTLVRCWKVYAWERLGPISQRKCRDLTAL